ncbi:hypothetical protein MPER_00214, partial [Moniliophthora perniciosa FA553]
YIWIMAEGGGWFSARDNWPDALLTMRKDSGTLGFVKSTIRVEIHPSLLILDSTQFFTLLPEKQAELLLFWRSSFPCVEDDGIWSRTSLRGIPLTLTLTIGYILIDAAAVITHERC